METPRTWSSLKADNGVLQRPLLVGTGTFEPWTTPFASTAAYHNDRTTPLEDLISAQRHHITEHDPLWIDTLLNTASGRVSLYVRLSFLSDMATQPCIWSSCSGGSWSPA